MTAKHAKGNEYVPAGPEDLRNTNSAASGIKKIAMRQKSVEFDRLSNADLLRLSRETKHPGIKASLKEIGADGLENYDGDFISYDGDLQIDGSFDTGDASVLIVRGNLSVTRVFRDRCNYAPACTIVFGDLQAQNVLTAGYLEVRGGLRASEAIVGDYNDGGAWVQGDLRAQLFLPFDHGFDVRGKTVFDETWDKAWNEAGTACVFTAVTARGEPTRPRRLAPGYYGQKEDGLYVLFAGKWDESHFTKALTAGKSVLA